MVPVVYIDVEMDKNRYTMMDMAEKGSKSEDRKGTLIPTIMS